MVELLMLGLGGAVTILGMLLGFFAVSAAEPPLRSARTEDVRLVSATPLPSRSRGPLAASPQKTNRVRPACRAR